MVRITTVENSKRRGRYTIRDIAEMAGVSRATVSLAMNNSPKVNAKTKEQILALIEEVGYRPNQTARNLVAQRSGTILVILPKIEHVFADVYFAECLSGIVEVTTQKQYHMMVDLATPEFKADRKAEMLFRQGTIDGVLCAGNLMNDKYLVDLAQSGCPLVLVNSSLPNVSRVIGNNTTVAQRAVEHLYSLGHRRIGHIRAPQSVTTAHDRTTGYMNALEALGLEPDPNLIADGYFDENSGCEAMRWLLARPNPPTAVFITNDVMAIGAMRAIRGAGMKVPDDIAIFGGDDIPMARCVQPPLSTIRQGMEAMGMAACEQLFLQMDGKAHKKSILMPLELVIRESCGATRRSRIRK